MKMPCPRPDCTGEIEVSCTISPAEPMTREYPGCPESAECELTTPCPLCTTDLTDAEWQAVEFDALAALEDSYTDDDDR
jgi:hypothetical protein